MHLKTQNPKIQLNPIHKSKLKPYPQSSDSPLKQPHLQSIKQSQTTTKLSKITKSVKQLFVNKSRRLT